MNEADATRVAKEEGCWLRSSIRTITYAAFAAGMLILILASRFLHLGLRRLRQPRIVSEFIVGLVVGNSRILRMILDSHAPSTLEAFAQITRASYMFVNGLEMDAGNILRRPGRDAIVAYAGTAAGVVFFLAMHRPLFHREMLSMVQMENGAAALIVALLLANTSSSVLTRLTTELKISKSDIGRLTVNAGIHNDMVTSLLLCFLSAAAYGGGGEDEKKAAHLLTPSMGLEWAVARALLAAVELAVQACLILKVAPPLMGWVNERNPEGKRMKGLDLSLSLLFLGGLCFLFSRLFFELSATAFLVGLFLPREGRLSTTLIRNFNFYLSAAGLPLYLCSAGLKTDLHAWSGVSVGRTRWTWASSFSMLAALFAVSTAGKVLGTLLSALRYGFRFPEALALGLLLNVKGHLHIFCTHAALVMLLLVMSTIVFIPLVVAAIVWRARRKGRGRRMALQWHDPAAELRVVVGIHGPHNVPAMIALVEATRGGKSQGPLAVYAMDLVELTERAGAALVRGHHGALDAVTVNDEAIRESSAVTTRALEAYAVDSGLTVRRLLTVSHFSNMHVDICNSAEDTLAVLVVLPFHRRQRLDGGMDPGHPGFRQVNEKVMKHAPCTVGILVDRGLGGPQGASASYATRRIAVVFVGGCDDREALFYAGRVAQHPGVQVTAIRFLHDAAGGGGGQEAETRVDDACFAEFYERHVAGGGDGVAYVEKYVANGAETVAALRAMEPLYDLFVVGRGGARSAAMTSGLSDWEECPELGPIGDILSSSDASATASVLVIQQHATKCPLPAADPDFAVI
ncbi:unnamed protein product [Spirodela intermedia]|uniref:Uncharacterized protein n=1 Tax=Spirodela intermedia TaxID=51605 RepID=A0A7I8KVN6_SPIIN|nr:unnamed protein product [Spirodela intermedia]